VIAAETGLAMAHPERSEPAQGSGTGSLHASGLKATLPRLKVLQIFRESGRRHLSAEDVYKTLLVEGSDIGLATVYRVLMQFVQAGLLERQRFEGDKAVFELNEGRHHDHLVCVRCGRVEEFVDAEIEHRQRQIAAERGFDLQEHALALYGVCSRTDCRGQSSQSDQSEESAP
jgi:Fur family transcriptional regulator, ferric uptake regulator